MCTCRTHLLIHAQLRGRRSLMKTREIFLTASKLNPASSQTVTHSFEVRLGLKKSVWKLGNASQQRPGTGGPRWLTCLDYYSRSPNTPQCIQVKQLIQLRFFPFLFFIVHFLPSFILITSSLNSKDTIMENEDNKVVIVDTEYLSAWFSFIGSVKMGSIYLVYVRF